MIHYRLWLFLVVSCLSILGTTQSRLLFDATGFQLGTGPVASEHPKKWCPCLMARLGYPATPSCRRANGFGVPFGTMWDPGSNMWSRPSQISRASGRKRLGAGPKAGDADWNVPAGFGLETNGDIPKNTDLSPKLLYLKIGYHQISWFYNVISPSNLPFCDTHFLGTHLKLTVNLDAAMRRLLANMLHIFTNRESKVDSPFELIWLHVIH